MAQSIPAQQQPALGGKRVLIAALVLGAITAGLIVAFLASRDGGETASPLDDSVDVVVAKGPIDVGQTIEASMLELRELPRDAVITGAATDISQVEGQTARYPLVQGEQFSIQRLVEPPKVKSLSFSIPKGMRGFTLPVDMTKSPAALAVPGDYVDVIVSFELVSQLPDGTYKSLEVEGSEPLQSAVTLLQNIQVLAVQRTFVDDGVVYDEATRGEPTDEDNVQFVTLAVTPDQAQTLWLLGQGGAFTLALRGFGDDEATPLVPVSEPYDFTALILN